MNNIYCIGELLIDMVSQDGDSYLKKPGGAPANVAVAISKLGGKSYFLGQVGKDNFGSFLKKTLIENNVDTSLMKDEGKTTLALVTLDKSGERSFEFYRGSDSKYVIAPAMIAIDNKDIIHFGSATVFLGGEIQETYYSLLKEGKSKGALITFDPNYRDVLITEDLLEEYKKHCWNFMKEADFIKLSDEEAMLLTNTKTLEESIQSLKDSNLKTIAITLGKEGTMLIEGDKSIIIGSIDIEQKDSTGAGDAFVGAVLYGLTRSENRDYGQIIEFANVVGAMTCEEYGAIPAIPTMDKVIKRKGEFEF
ncbi:MAG: carbohydrate kinase [Clostridium sp.]|nr:carbohydrate kinase [Clostridium sp.]